MNGYHDSDQPKCKLKVCSEINSFAPLFATDFSNGQVDRENITRLQFESFRKATSSHTIDRSANRVLMANAGRLNYQGSIEGDRSEPVCYFVGVRNKSTRKMKLYSSVKFNMKPVIPKPQKPTADVDVKTPKGYREMQEDLSLSFGSKAKMRAMTSRLKYSTKNDEDSIDEDKFLDNISLSESLTPMSAGQIVYFPNQVKDAATVDQVFDIYDIISLNEYNELYVQIEIFNTISDSGLEQMKKSFCSYVNKHLVGDLSLIDTEKLKYLLYYNYLIQIQNVSTSALRNLDPIPLVPNPFKQCILSKFTVLSKTPSGKGTKQRPPHMKDKLLSYIIVLALFIDNYSVNLNDVLADLQSTSFPKLVTICKAIGCHVTDDKSGEIPKKYATLKLPLFVMPTKHGRKMKR